MDDRKRVPVESLPPPVQAAVKIIQRNQSLCDGCRDLAMEMLYRFHELTDTDPGIEEIRQKVIRGGHNPRQVLLSSIAAHLAYWMALSEQ